MKSPRVSHVPGWVLMAVLSILIVHFFVIIRSAEHLDRARALARCGQIYESAREYQTAIGYAAPFNPYSRAAAEELEAMAEEYSLSRPILGANLYDRLHRSLRGTRWLLQPEGMCSAQPPRPVETAPLSRTKNGK